MKAIEARGSLAIGNLVVSWLAIIAVVTTDVGVLRALACLILVIGTGVALVPLLGIKDTALELTLILLVSIVVLICVAQLITYAAAFSWRPCAIGLLCVTLLGTSVQIAAALISRRAAR